MGFTLLEMLMVVALMAIVAIGMSTVFITDTSWKNGQETEQRWQAIRAALYSPPNISLNSESNSVGYVVDMGRLPSNLKELVSQGAQPAWSATAIAIPAYTAATGYTNTLYGGWRGAYLYTAGRTAYRDAWENKDTNTRADGGSIDDDVINFGWRVTMVGTSPNFTAMSVVSLGGDNANGGSEPDSIDFPSAGNMLDSNDWLLPTGQAISFTIQFGKAITAAFSNLELRLYRYVDNGDTSLSFASDIEEQTADDTFNLSSGATSASATVTLTQHLPAGSFAAVLWCTDPEPDVVFDGDCDGGNVQHSPAYVTLGNRTSSVNLMWNIP